MKHTEILTFICKICDAMIVVMCIFADARFSPVDAKPSLAHRKQNKSCLGPFNLSIEYKHHFIYFHRQCIDSIILTKIGAIRGTTPGEF